MAERKRRELDLAQLLPNMMTVGALCAGLTGIRYAIQGNFQLAVTLILLAAVLDGLDGRLARLLRSVSEMGAELDSLGDFVNFGVAPALVIYLWDLHNMGTEGWGAAMFYAVCCLLRLARFNIGNRPSADKPADVKVKGAPFTGVPSPGGAMLVLLPLYVSFTWPELPRMPSALTALYIMAVGGLMISRLPTPSFKSVTFYAENVRYVVLALVLLAAALASHTWATMMAIDATYAAAILIYLVTGRHRKATLASPEEPETDE
jgi:CDP-diacylglycerol---serine O-phosphatidyltransferase